ncbi:MAG: hypothetical protein FJ096_08450 [Deltaproteobacteria bacterium]|nr:hypothetical protein [Deltaproteobacteria bacterium]
MNPNPPHDCGEGCDEPGHHAFPGLAAHDVLPTPDAPATLPEPSEAVLELAAACVRFVNTMVSALSGKASPDLAPDYTSETLSLLDYYVAESRRSLADRPEAVPLTAGAVGAYLGEVVRRQHRCWWRTDGGDPATWRLDFEAASLSFYPVQVAQTLLAPEEGEDEPWSGFELREEDRDEVAARLAELPPVSEEDYLLPSTRLEVLDIALETVIGKLVDDPLAKRALRPDDYE